MLEKLFGSKTAERVLMYLFVFQEGYPTEISRIFSIPLNMIQKQLFKFEEGGMLVSRLRGKVRIYQWNPRYPFLNEVEKLLERNFEYLPEVIKERYYRQRTRPRRRDKK
ncbi:MAG: winged helix-turn-helix transcriptional regulator [Candidatus Aminicenantes bacterium]|jgi:DNA-binding transcriptional ArsR family regulator|nr:winged helix-turn-helix transcriptional regulator [Candidatus Aminicenantes bacterium]